MSKKPDYAEIENKLWQACLKRYQTLAAGLALTLSAGLLLLVTAAVLGVMDREGAGQVGALGLGLVVYAETVQFLGFLFGRFMAAIDK